MKLTEAEAMAQFGAELQQNLPTTRAGMEAHLTLHGWQPARIGRCAAVKDDWVIYLSNGKSGAQGSPTMQHRTGLNLDPEQLKRKLVWNGIWFMGNAFFWPLARACCAQETVR